MKESVAFKNESTMQKYRLHWLSSAFLLLSLLAALPLSAQQKGDSLLVSDYGWKVLYRVDSVYYLKRVYIEAPDSVVVEVREADKYDLQDWRENAHRLLPFDSIQLNADVDLDGKKLVVDKRKEYVFYDTDCFATVTYRFHPDHYYDPPPSYRDTIRYRNEYASHGLWNTLRHDGLNFAVQYWYSEEDSCLQPNALLIPLKNGHYYMSSDTRTVYAVPERNDIDPDDLVAQYRNMHHVDMVRIAGKAGLYTRFGREVLPAAFDSIWLSEPDFLIPAYRNKLVTLYNHRGRLVKDSLKAAILVRNRYQVIDSRNRMYYVDAKGNEISNYQFIVWSVDDQLFPLPYDVLLLSKNKYREHACWIHFIYPDYEEAAATRKWRRENYDKFLADTIVPYGLDELEYSPLTHSEEYQYYNFRIYPLPEDCKKMVFANSNTVEYHRSGDYRQLPAYWIVAQKRGKYGLFDIRNPDEPLLPFEYNRITGVRRYFNAHLLLEHKGLKCYYPISSTPRYKEIDPFIHSFARFTLPNGRKGWLGLDGKEYLD